MADSSLVTATSAASSLSSSEYLTVSSTSPTTTRTTARISPGLQRRLALLDEQAQRLLGTHRTFEDIGRIPEEQLAELEERLRRQELDPSLSARPHQGRATPWIAPPNRAMPSGGVLLSGGPAPSSETELSSVMESDVNSSPISLGTRLVPSDSEEGNDYECEEDALQDGRKYRMPDGGKTRLDLRTKEPMSPTPRQARSESPRGSIQSEPRSPTLRQARVESRRGSIQSEPRSPTLRQARVESRRESLQSGLTSADSRRESLQNEPVTPRENGIPRSESPDKGNSPRANGWANGSSENASDSDWIGSGLSRAGSIYSLGRASFTGQLSHLTSMKLPDAGTLAKKISSIPTSTEAAKALSDATDQIMLWIGKASEALGGLNAEDDVDWAAAGGREGVEEVDGAIHRFEKLIQVYIVAIEKLQTRDDIELLTADELNSSVNQLEGVIMAWQNIKHTLRGIREQVEVAMEWTELWNSVLGEIASEMESLNRLVFEMEEKRHEGAESLLTIKDSLDLNELETIIEEKPGRGRKVNNRFIVVPPFSPSSPLQPSDHVQSKEDASLLALFARMQPLRASLDFLPMRLSTFHIRGGVIFPTACEDLDRRSAQLEEQWGKLEDDAEALRRELGEDRWILVFRNAGRQALKMCESVSRSFLKLRDGIDSGEQQSNMPDLSKKIENYEAKVQHYGPAIERVLAIIDKGVQDRLTVNGEILRLQSDMKLRWSTLQGDIKDMELVLGDINIEAKERQLRDSVSTVMSSERSLGSSLFDTRSPGSSPASSVAAGSRKSSFQGSRTPTPLVNTKTRKITFTPSTANRPSSRVLSSSSASRRGPITNATFPDIRGSPSPLPSTPPSASVSTSAWTAHTAASRSDNRPRWTTVSKAQSRDFAPLSKFEPSPYAKAPITPKPYIPRQIFSSMPSTAPPVSSRRTPAGSRIFSEPVIVRPPSAAFSRAETPTSRKSSLPVAVPKPPTVTRPASALATRRPPSSVRASLPAPSTLKTRRSSMLPVPPSFRDGNDADSESLSPSSAAASRRPPSALASGRKSSARARSRLGVEFEDAVAGSDRSGWR
jgi:hypothetical protein